MSQISVLGFKPSYSSFSSSSPSSPNGHTHWAILISPHPSAQKPKKSKTRLFHTSISTKESQSDTALFDMYKHQLRQQVFPIPLKEGSSGTSAPLSGTTPSGSQAPTSDQSSTGRTTAAGNTTTALESTPESVTITTLNADSAHPLQLAVQITASNLPQTPQRLIPKLSQRLYNTPTYGPEDDWLRAALSVMHDCLLEPGFDVDKFIDYASTAAKDHAMYEASSEDENENGHGEQQPQRPKTTRELPVVTLDYSAHIARNAQVKAMLHQLSPKEQKEQQQQHQTLLTPPQSPQIPHANYQQQQQPQQQQQQQTKARTWLGFRISPSPGATNRHAADRYSFERQDDPYGGLM